MLEAAADACFPKIKLNQKNKTKRGRGAPSRPLLCIRILFSHHQHHHHQHQQQQQQHCVEGSGEKMCVTFWELHLPSSKMSPRMNTISGLSSHRAVWKALSICHSLCVRTQRVSAICCVVFTHRSRRSQRPQTKAGDGSRRRRVVVVVVAGEEGGRRGGKNMPVTSSACRTSVPRRLPGGACPTAP